MLTNWISEANKDHKEGMCLKSCALRMIGHKLVSIQFLSESVNFKTVTVDMYFYRRAPNGD